MNGFPFFRGWLLAGFFLSNLNPFASASCLFLTFSVLFVYMLMDGLKGLAAAAAGLWADSRLGSETSVFTICRDGFSTSLLTNRALQLFPLFGGAGPNSFLLLSSSYGSVGLSDVIASRRRSLGVGDSSCDRRPESTTDVHVDE